MENNLGRKLYRIIMPLVLVFFFTGCRQARQLTPVIPDREVNQVLTAMHTAQARFDFFSARFSGVASLNGDNTDIAGTIRIKRDSAIFISIAPILGIEVARVLITPESVQVLNRLESTFFDGDMQVINSMLRAELDYYMLQSVLLGNDFAHFSADNFRLDHTQEAVRLFSPARRQLTPGSNPSTTYRHELWLDQHAYRILQSELTDNMEGRKVRASYPSYTSVQGQMLPSEVLVAFDDENAQAALSMRYSRITLDQPQQISFSIPPRYRPMDF